jgi:hypothetical protein
LEPPTVKEPYTLSDKEARLSQADLMAQYCYDPDSGKFSHRVRKNNRTKAGDPAGHLEHSGYFSIGIGNEIFQAHRLAWLYVFGEFPRGYIDHINGDRGDNRLMNLRVASRSQNGMNQRVHRDNRTGFKGVSKKRNKYCAQIKCDGRMKHIGIYSTPEEASAAYQQYAAAKWGVFAAGSAK